MASLEFQKGKNSRAKLQLEEANPKNGFLRAKQALSKHGVLKDQNWSHF